MSLPVPDAATPLAPRFDAVDPSQVRRVALLSVHTSPLEQPGEGDGGGLNVYVLEVSRRLAASGVDVDVFTRATAPDQPASVEVDVPAGDGRLTVHRIVAGPARPVAKEALANHLCAFALALQRHPTAGTHDLVHAHYWLSGWVGRRVAARWGVPFVQTFHTLGALKNASLAPGDVPEPALRLAAEQRIAAAADRVLGLTCGEAGLLHRAYRLSGARIGVVPAGVDLDLFDPAPRPQDPAVLEAVGESAPGPLLLFVGRLQPLKGPDVAVRTLAEVRRQVPTARLLVVGGVSGSGDGRSDPDALAALARELGVEAAVRIVPALPQRSLAALYRRADVVLAPSRSETFGLVALEAQASGTPVVAARVAGLAYVVGRGGTLVDGHEARDHAAAVVRYLADDETRVRAARAGVRAAAASSWERTAQRLLAVYADVLDGHARGRQVLSRAG